jgi:uncharacterized protein (TIGR03435 family)
MIAFSTVLDAQTILGTWQGTAPLGSPQRIVVKITKTADGTLRGTITLIDRSAIANPVPTVNYTAPDLSLELGGISYRGKLSADGKSIDGTWTVGTQISPVTLVLTTPDTVWAYAGPAPIPMAATADPSFEVATIKPSPPGGGGVMFNLRVRKFQARNVSAKELIKIAYNVRGRQVIGGPTWIEDTKFDVEAEPDTSGVPSEEQTRTMVRKLVEERFGLKKHLEQREFQVFAMTVEKSSAKLMKSDSANDFMNIYSKQGADGDIALQFVNTTMVEFAGLMMNFIQSHQIVDETGLTGRYDFAVIVPANALRAAGPEDDPDSAYTHAIQPLGLKFVLKKEPLKVIMVDHLDSPSPN